MKIIGIVVEYNPLHTGHMRHIDEIKARYPESIIIAAMSGNVVQRGEFSIVSKFDRAIEAINNKVDLVVEIPSFFVLNNANLYAHKAVQILNDFKVDEIIFGSESNNIADLKAKVKEIEKISDDDYKDAWKQNYSMPKTLDKLSNLDFKSNDILGLCYLSEGYKINQNLEFNTIKRIRNEKYNSAFVLRQKINNQEDISDFIPNRWIYQDDIKLYKNSDFEIFWKYDLYTKATVEKEISFLKNQINQDNNIDLNNLSSKNFTKAKLKRENMKFSLEIGKTNYSKWRVLSYSNTGKEYLAKNRDIEYSTKYLPIYENELKIARVLSLKYGKKVIINEINFNPEYANKLRLERNEANESIKNPSN